MSALALARQRPEEVQRARVTLAAVLLRTGRRTAELVATLCEETGVSRATAFRVLRAARDEAKQ